ncbi:oxalate decarboxylase/phosphoglucose isomerase-like protein (cupin superfamily) [Streptomyces griseochromogenes]|uniref:Cupin n=1 Tax=Streptomyces griseochromogenes TaxID=68214 RepID=A0A1B1B2E2_9ACTN|nr:cupin domain-containing protein [Streptomyces griseochromogenes]ANP52983.1 cupin [Streptomyces griseochromogenes]MBP2047639.1 oxalate decarboxylase/phosphoglucose isomerase-like protein (cupin superfamily) [Streptomyces griseochromogenes]
MTTTPLSSIDLFASALHIHPNGNIRVAERRMTSGDSGAWQIATFHVETDADVHADHWEMHPEAEEAVCCLTGSVRLYLRPASPGGIQDMVRLQAGHAVIVPRGRWHRLELDAPSDLMSITLRHGTRLEKRTDTH